jgi:hypothetical protein
VGPLSCYRQVWAVDFEFMAPPGWRPRPICCVARELRSGRLERLWLWDDHAPAPPYDTGPDCLFVSYYASAELGCHLDLGWPTPPRILDLCAEFRCLTSGLETPCGRGLLGALAYYGLDGLDASEKADMRELALRGGPYTPAEQTALLDYCQSDVDSLARLLHAMLPEIDLPRALLRGRYMAAAARIEWAGVPIDTDTLSALVRNWERIKGRLIAAVDRDYGVFVPTGQREINPDSTLGAAILREAEANGIDPRHLADAVEDVWREEKATHAEAFEARKAARRATGLTQKRINQWEDAGKGPACYPGLDVAARELAGCYPALGIGPGYTSGAGYGDTDYGANLWEVLRDRDERTPPKHDPSILRQAVERVARCPAADADRYAGPLTFSAAKWEEYLIRKGIAWPRLASGALALDDETFREMSHTHPDEVGPIRDVLRIHRGELKKIELTVGPDGRNRYLLSAFGSRTGRNQPSNTRSIFGPAAWLRSLIAPGPGQAVAYCDWAAQELAAAAVLSGDLAMQEAYLSGDPYIWLARKAGAVPDGATKTTHPKEREAFKVVSLGVLYGLSAEGVARKLGVAPCRGRELLRMHQQTFRTFWKWSEQVEMEGMLTGRLRTVFGWRVHVAPNANPRSLRNFPMQATGAEMLRLACCLVTEAGVTVCAPVHDALLVEAPSEQVHDVVARTVEMMRKASAVTLGGFEIRVDAKVVKHPERFRDDRGRRTWETVLGILAEVDRPEDPLH